ncbi:GNAT family N-acetyltransferase [Agromyces atrinae]|uniref:GNAT family N-acetyltransferase n=1 Tax=Agromyces atrinae TaxID=592376 RepID=A0A4Q2MCQ3_9MICO|nr:GNAT family N-acetyltransferase [Agromyces atrinae]NYD67947.1 ribosomal protein S18 acetylase RimI-like enzyme [Agromyces atrinae]RXZ87891.1 GNAT family N-acetyltransferase [Agromyces atrinae]
MTTIRRAHDDDVTPAAAVLAAAFDEYPWTRWSIPTEDYADRLERLQELYLGHALRTGLVVVDDSVSAVAAFLPPGAPDPDADIQSEIIRLHGSRIDALGALTLPPTDPAAWSLATVGVHPSRHGLGLGTRIIAAGLDMIGAAPVALETSSDRNVTFYERLGFTTIEVTRLPDGPTVHSMLRRAQP